VATPLLPLPAIVPPNDIGELRKLDERVTHTSCKDCNIRQSDIHLGEIEAIGIGEDKGVAVISCPWVDDRGSISHGCEEVKEVDT
jgi:hypothetical protein